MADIASLLGAYKANPNDSSIRNQLQQAIQQNQIDQSQAAAGDTGEMRRQSAGSNQGFIDGGSLETNDPRAAIAERLGKIMGAMAQNTGSMSSSNGRYQQNLAAQYGPLKELYDQMTGQHGPGLSDPSPRSGGGGSGGNHSSRSGGLPSSISRLPPQIMAQQSDPYARIRHSAMAAAERYLNVRNPHLVSSLGDNEAYGYLTKNRSNY